MQKLRFKNDWFDIQCVRESLRQLPAECVADCSGAGSKDSAVAYWLERLQFDAPAFWLRSYLKEFGAWDAGELCDHDANRARTLWIWANDVWEKPGACDYLYLHSV